MWPNKDKHHIEYLKRKLIAAISHANNISGALFISHKHISDKDRTKIINYLQKTIDVDLLSIKITSWFIGRYYYSYNIVWIQQILNLDEKNIKLNRKSYKNNNLDNYFSSMNDNNLQKIINAMNEHRQKIPLEREYFDLMFNNN